MNLIRRNLVWLLFAQTATWVVSISLLLVAPRILGDRTFGDLSFVIVFVSFFELVANMGTNTFVVKSIARDADSLGRYVVSAVVMKLCLALVLAGLALVVGASLGLSHTMLFLIGAYSAGMVINSVGTTIGAALTGLQLIADLAKWNIVQCYVGGIAGVLILLGHGSVIAFAVVFNLAFIIPIPFNLRRLWPYVAGNRRIEPRLWPVIMKGGFPFFILAGLLVLYGTIDVPLLQAMSGSEAVGWYALAYRWVSVPAFFAASVATAFFPALSAEGVELAPSFGSLANRAARIAVLVATPAAIGIALVADPFVTFLYGAEFRESVPLLRILALHIPIVSLDIVLGSVAMAADRQRRWVIISVIATIFNPVLNLVAIPQAERLFDNGAIGAAVVTVFTEIILLVGGIAIRPKGVLDRTTVNGLLRIVLASSTMIPVVLLVRDAPLAVQIGAGAATYVLSSLLLRTISIDEIRGWTGALGRRGGRGSPDPSDANHVDSPRAAAEG
ncbi:MAG TPA: flippase [Ilumatobacteraceae bacterium]|nr:flippase [Ilumatobacteraceae bacterium]